MLKVGFMMSLLKKKYFKLDPRSPETIKVWTNLWTNATSKKNETQHHPGAPES